jgi:PAS domain S-box-containing protein
MQKASIGDLGADSHCDFPIVIATMAASARHRKVSIGVVIVLAVIVAVTIPFANIQLARVDAFVPVIQTVMCVADLLTALLLFAQYAVYPQRAALALASGYVFSGLFAFLQTLAFPGAYAPAGLIGDKLNSAGWLFVLWHTAFLVNVIVYTLSKEADGDVNRSCQSTGVTIGVTIAGVAAVTAGSTWGATMGVGYLPSLYENTIQQAAFANDVNLFLWLLNSAALVLLFVRRRTILDQWLIVTLLAWLPNFVVAVLFTIVRFTVGWYMARVFALFAGSSLLFALLAETVVLYTQLANAIVLLRRERTDRLAIFNTVADGIITFDHSGIVETLNPAAARLFGYSPEAVIGRNVKMLIPESDHRGRDGPVSDYLRMGQANVSGSGCEIAGQRKDGSIFPMELAVNEMGVAGRRMFTGIVRDITERKRAEKHQALMVAELDHRVKNVLAQVAALATSTSQGSRSIDEFLRSLQGRIQSMAAAHNLSTKSGWQGVGLDALVRNQLAPYATGTNMTISGTDVMLTSAGSQAVARVLHELATNAAKYGALSTPGGQISAHWDRKSNGKATNLVLVWRELGGPPMASKVHSSYGTTLIRNLIPHELGGTVDLQFAAEGVNCRIEIPSSSFIESSHRANCEDRPLPVDSLQASLLEVVRDPR